MAVSVSAAASAGPSACVQLSHGVRLLAASTARHLGGEAAPPQDIWDQPRGGGRSCPSSKEQNASALHGLACSAGRSLGDTEPYRVVTRLLPMPGGPFFSHQTPSEENCNIQTSALILLRVIYVLDWANPKPGFRQVWDVQGGDKRHWGESLHHDLGSGSTRNASCHPLVLCLLHSAPNHPSPCHRGAGPAAGTVQLCLYTDTSCLVVTLSCTSLYVRAGMK